RHDRPVPDIRMDVKPAATVTPEHDEPFRRHVVARQRQRHDKALAMHRVEQLSTVRMVIGAPDERASAGPGRAVRGGLVGPGAPAKEITVANRIIACEQRLALPPELKQPFGNATLISRVLVDRAPPLGRPADNLDGERGGLADEAAVPLEVVVAGDDNWGLMR